MKIKSNKNLKRKHEYDAGIDIPLSEGWMLEANKTTVINTGVQVEIPRGMMGVLISRSSASKRGLITAMSPIDSGYTGFIHAIVTNTSDVAVNIGPGESVCQLVILPIVLVELTNEPIDDDRRAGAFGSTNT